MINEAEASATFPNGVLDVTFMLNIKKRCAT